MKTSPISGFLNIDKPYGMTSMDVVRRIRRATGVRRVGHAGTLDPIATGVIPVAVGRATRVIEYLVDSPKVYTGGIVLGISTDSYDAMGEVTGERGASSISRERIEEVLCGFRGTVAQVPPMFSALKRDGKRLYELARKGIEIEREPRQVEVYDLQMIAWEPPVATLRVRCGKGFYMRSLAHDVGESLRCGAHLKSLVREEVGPFRVDAAASLEEVEESFQDSSWGDLLHEPDSVLSSMRALVLGTKLRKLVCNGRPIPLGAAAEEGGPDERCRAYGTDGAFLAVVRFDASRRQWQPEKVFGL